MLVVGPISEANGFPVWYRDENGLRLQLNTDPNDPFSGLTPQDIPDPSRPVSFPDNFPEEALYFAAEAEMTTGTGERARLVLALEAAFVNEVPREGEQIVFGRVRVRIFGLRPNVQYTVRHPYGVDTFTAEPDPGDPSVGEINFTEDIGDMNGGNFEVAASSRIQPFLRWDPGVAPAAPVGYIGDPNVLHPITGSVFVDGQGRPQNYFRIEGPGIGVGSPDRVTDNVIEIRFFSLLGKISNISGVEVTRATYSRENAAGGFLDVFAKSDITPQNIVLSGENFDPTTMEGSQGIYFAHVFFEGAPPEEVVATNVSDNPDSVQTAVPFDLVSGDALYNTDTDQLMVTAETSDQFTNPVLTVVGFGQIPAGGILTVSAPAFIPPFVTVTSEAGGQLTIPVIIAGSPFNPIGVQADAGPDQTVLRGNQVTLDGTGSSGPIETYEWSQLSGPPVTLSGSNSPNATFVAPNNESTLEFALTVTGAGGPSTDTVSIIVVNSAPAPVANAGPDQTVRQGTVVALSGSSSTTPVTFLWQQLSGNPVQLNGPDTPNPTFTFPKRAEVLVFRLTVNGAGGSSSDTVRITGLPDNLAVTRIEFRTRDSEWRVDGTSDVFGPGVTITIYLGTDTSGPVLAQAEVDDALGEWSYREEGSTVQPDASRTITVESSSGGILSALPIVIRQ